MKTKKTTDNGRFGVMAAVTPQKRQCKLGSLYPAGSSVEAATTPSRRDVMCNVGDSVPRRDRIKKRLKNCSFFYELEKILYLCKNFQSQWQKKN